MMNWNDSLKRIFDVFFSLIVLVSIFPCLLIIAIFVKCTSKGPIIYRSIRLGKEGKIFYCLKFRTMNEHADKMLDELLLADSERQAEWSVYHKLKRDPRITSMGHFLRKFSLDETPQFINVLLGDLSVVGPRPLSLPGLPCHFLQKARSIYGENTNLILSVRPGITGVWQVSGRSHISLLERQKMEANYVLKRSLFTDLILIAKTIPAVLFSKGAY